MDKSKNDEHVTKNFHEPFSTRAVVTLRERNGDRGGNNDLYLGNDGFDPERQEARDVSFSGNDGRVVYTVRIGVSA